MEMCRESSAKRGFKAAYKKTDFVIERDVMINILKREEELRFSEEYQRQYTDCGDDTDRINQVSLTIQRQALCDCGITDPRGLDVLHNIRVDYDLESILDIPVYIRTDRFYGFYGMAVGSAVPEKCDVTKLDGTSINLQNYIRETVGDSGKFMVLRIHEYAAKYSSVAAFTIIYISEAHPYDIWPLGSTVSVKSHANVQERLQIAKSELVENRGCSIPVLVDGDWNQFEYFFDAWPERFFIIKDNKMVLVPQPSLDIDCFDVSEIPKFLDQFL